MKMNSPFRMPNPVKITGRISSVTNAFVNGIIPVVYPSREEVEEALHILDMSSSNVVCAYCGDTATEWDHLRPLVKDKKPTGYISEISNLVPSCGKCNQSKGNKYWRDWMRSNAAQSPTTRNIADLDLREERLMKYEQWKQVSPLDFETIVGSGLWSSHWENYEKVVAEMQRSQKLAERIRLDIKRKYEEDHR